MEGSLAAKERRKKIREKMLVLGGLIPGGSKMNTAEMLQTAFKYVKFLQAQLGILMLPVTVTPNSISNADPYDLPCPDLIQFRTEYPIGQCSHAPYIEAPDFTNSLPILNIDSSSALLEPVMPISELSVQSSSPPKPQFDPSLVIDLPLLPESQDLVPEFGDMSFAGQFGCAESSQAMEVPMALEFFDVDVDVEFDIDVDIGGHCVKIEPLGTSESFFGDFSSDIFDCLDQHPAS